MGKQQGLYDPELEKDGECPCRSACNPPQDVFSACGVGFVRWFSRHVKSLNLYARSATSKASPVTKSSRMRASCYVRLLSSLLGKADIWTGVRQFLARS
jgi:hypothetical protein